MARTQILKDIRPNIFLDMRKVFGILFFILSHIVFAHVGIETKPNFGLEAEILVLDSIIVDQKDSVESEEKIYVTSEQRLLIWTIRLMKKSSSYNLQIPKPKFRK